MGYSDPNYLKNYREKNKEQIIKKKKKYYLDNREAILKKRAEYVSSHPNKIKNYYQENKIRILKQKKDFYLLHKKELNTLRNEQMKKARKENVRLKLIYVLRSRFNSALQRNSKASSILKLIDCSIEELKVYLENQFKPGMTWNNHSLHGWHIDHITSCAKFDLTNPEEQRKCFHYSNLQPLWAKENNFKRAKIL